MAPATESHAVAKKRSPRTPTVPPPELERIEFLVPLGWTERIDAAANRRMQNRSDFIRQLIIAALKEDDEEA